MPKSKLRKKVQEHKAHDEQVHAAEAAPAESPRWLVPVMLTNFLLGLIWIVIYYVSQTRFPISGIGAWNMIVGFSFVAVGFSLATKWR
jgi:hypothetical protein